MAKKTLDPASADERLGVLLVQGAILANRLWKDEQANGDESERSRVRRELMRHLKAARQVELVRGHRHLACLAWDRHPRFGEPMLSVGLVRRLSITNERGETELVHNAHHLPLRVAQEWMTAEEIEQGMCSTRNSDATEGRE